MSHGHIVAADGFTTSGSATSLTGSFGLANGSGTSRPAVAGDLLVAFANIATDKVNVTAPAGYSPLATSLFFSGGPSLFGVAKFAAGGETGATFSHNQAALSMAVAVTAFSGTLNPLSIDKSANNGSDFAQHTSQVAGPTTTLAQADELILAFAALAGAAASPGASTGTLLFAIQSNSLLVSFRNVSATTAVSETFSWTNSNFCEASIGTVKAGAVVLTDDGWDIA